jgi:hypothetical protein
MTDTDPDIYGRTVWAEDAVSDFGIAHGMINPGDEGPLGRGTIADVGAEIIRNLIHLARTTDGMEMVTTMLTRGMQEASADFVRHKLSPADARDSVLLDHMEEAVQGVTEP